MTGKRHRRSVISAIRHERDAPSRGDEGPDPTAQAAVPLQAEGAREGEAASAAQGVPRMPLR
ncbi:MAG: hypothetical protein C0453_21545, partial [Comamonadaceae bacterium]|nr:hypothetical protein [Comamonadaceae bacterium]